MKALQSQNLSSYYVWLQRNPILYLTVLLYKQTDRLQWMHLLGLPLLTLKLYANKVNLQPQFIKKLSFSEVCGNFKNFLPSVYKFSKGYTLVYRCFHI